MSRELLKREMENYSHLWKNKENNINRNISQVIIQRQRGDWQMSALVKEAKEQIAREK